MAKLTKEYWRLYNRKRRAKLLVWRKNYRKRWPEKVKASRDKYTRKHRAEINALLNKLKNVPCMDCRRRYPPYVMDFDHRDPKKKLFAVASGKMGSKAKLLAEASKCDVVCSNCHRIRTHGGN